MTDNELVAPRPLTSSDTGHLRTIFELQLHITNQEDEDDAADLINYALDMVGRGKNVGSVIEELEFMEYEVCDAVAAQKIGKCLISFFREVIRETETGKLNKIDLSTKAASRKHSKEMHQTLLSGSVSAAQRSKKGIYNNRGELTKQWAGVKEYEEMDMDERRHQYFQELKDDKVRKGVTTKKQQLDAEKAEQRQRSVGLNLSANAASHRPYSEIEALQSTADERRGIKKQIYNQRGELNSWNKREEDVDFDKKEMDLSTTGNLKKKQEELDALRATGEGRRGAKGRIYGADGSLNAQWNSVYKGDVEEADLIEEEVPPPVEANSSFEELERRRKELENQRREEFESLMRERGLGRKERAERIEAIRQKYAAMQNELAPQPEFEPKPVVPRSRANDGDCQQGMDLSTTGNLKKKQAELQALRASGGERRGVKGRIYGADGSLNAQWNSVYKDDDTVDEAGLIEEEVPPPVEANSSFEELERRRKELDNQRRKEFEALMRDRSLSRQERAESMEEIRQKYAALAAELMLPEPESHLRGSYIGSSDDRDCRKGMDLSTQGTLKKKQAELNALRATGGERKGVKGRIYRADGSLCAQWNNVYKEGDPVEERDQNEGEQHSHNPDMDLSAKGYQRKKSQELDSIRASGGQRRGVKDRIYDSSGNLNAWTSLKEEPEFESTDEFTMDLSAKGMELKKAREMEAIRRTADPQGLKQRMYDENGHIVGTTNNDGEQVRHNPDMDLSAAGMKLKKAREMEAIRRTANPQGLKQKMYDEIGNLILSVSNDGHRHNLDMDTSAEGMRLKKAREMETLRATGRGRKEVKKKQMYDEHGNLVAWNSLRKIDVEEDRKLPSNMDLTPEGMKLKKAREIATLRSAGGAGVKAQMYNADGNIVGASNNDVEQNRHNSGMDLSAAGMKLKKAREMELLRRTANPRGLKQKMYDENGNLILSVSNDGEHEMHNSGMDTSAVGMMRKKSMELESIRTGTIDVNHKETVAPRELTDDETSSLRELLKSKLRIPNDSYEEDASDLLDYAFDMVSDGKAAGSVTEELVFMEMEVLTAEMVESFGRCLSTFLLGLDSEGFARRSKTAMYDGNGNIIEKKGTENEVADEPRIDLSTMAAAMRPKQEVQATLLSSGTMSAKERRKNEIYDENGVLIKQWNFDSDDDKDEAAVHGINLSAGAAAKRANREVDSLLVKKKSGGGLGHRLSKYKDFVKPRGGYHHEGDGHDDERMNSLALPAKSARDLTLRPSREVGATLSTSEGGASAKERNKQVNYDKNGVLIKQWSGVEKEEIEDIDAHIDEQRKLYFNHLEDENNLRDRIAKRDQQLAEQRKERESDGQNVGPTLKLSAHSQARKPAEEVRALRAISDPQGVKREIYDENGALIKQWSSVYDDEDEIEKSEDEKRREELQLIMMDQSLKREERAERMEEVKKRYAAASESNQGSGKDTCPLVPVAVDSARAEQRQKEFESIMRDRTLSREERKLKLEEIKKEYSTGSSVSKQGRGRAASSEKVDEKDPKLDLSALAFARKASKEVQATLLSESVSAKERGKHEIYDENGLLTKQWASVNEGEDEGRNKEDNPNSSFKAFISKSVDEQRREELQVIMRDRSLTKDERAERIEVVKMRYAAAAAGRQEDVVPQQPDRAPRNETAKNCHGKTATLDAQRRRELKAIMKNRSLDSETKNRLMEEVKVKYDNQDELNQEAEDDKAVPSAVNDEPLNLSADAFSQKHLKELQAIKAKTAQGKSLKDRMSVFNNDTAVYYDEVSFSVSQNKSKSARQTAQRETKESNKSYNYSYGDGGVVDEQTAEFKAMGDDNKAAKNDAKESSKKYNYKSPFASKARGQPVINCDPLAFAVKNNKSAADRKTAKRVTKESNKLYNYSYGDGGVVGEQTAEFKAMGDGDKAAKKDTKKSAKKINYKSPFASKSKDQPVIDCDPLSFAVKNNKSAADQKSVKRDTKESAKLYNYRYTGFD